NLQSFASHCDSSLASLCLCVSALNIRHCDADSALHGSANSIQLLQRDRQRRHDDDDIAERAEPHAFTEGVLTDADAAFFGPAERLFRLLVTDEFDAGDQAALPDVAD